MNPAIFRCHFCGMTVNSVKEESTQCSECEKHFCSAYHKSCFSNHTVIDGCSGSPSELNIPIQSIKSVQSQILPHDQLCSKCEMMNPNKKETTLLIKQCCKCSEIYYVNTN